MIPNKSWPTQSPISYLGNYSDNYKFIREERRETAAGVAFITFMGTNTVQCRQWSQSRLVLEITEFLFICPRCVSGTNVAEIKINQGSATPSSHTSHIKLYSPMLERFKYFTLVCWYWCLIFVVSQLWHLQHNFHATICREREGPATEPQNTKL